MKQSSVVTHTAFHFSSRSVIKQMYSVISLPFNAYEVEYTNVTSALLVCWWCISYVSGDALASMVVGLEFSTCSSTQISQQYCIYFKCYL